MRRLKSVTALSTAALGSSLLLTGCGGEGEGEGEGVSPDTGKGTIAATGGEGAEGEGGEGEGAAPGVDVVNDDVAFLHQLGQVRGHLFAFITLHRAGATQMAATHAKHPESELYSDLQPGITARNLPGFADALSALVDAQENSGEVETAYAQVVSKLDAHAPDLAMTARLKSLSMLTRTAADEYKLGVDDTGAIVNAHEYQDAYGFLNAGLAILEKGTAQSDNQRKAVETAKKQLMLALTQFGDLTAKSSPGNASVIYGAAAQIEIAGLGL